MSATRRQFLQTALASGLCLFGADAARAFSTSRPARAGRSYFEWAQLKYPGAWNPNPRGPERFLSELRRRTSVEPSPQPRAVEPGDAALFELPFLYVTGRGALPADEATAAWVRRYVEYGGFLLFDDASGFYNSAFRASVEALCARAFPESPLAPLPADHAVFQTFYLFEGAPGRKIVDPKLYGVAREDLTPVLFCANDLSGAWDGDLAGSFTNPCIPGGERQREMSMRLGVNLVMYALTGNYKKDQVHLPFILKRRQRR